MKLNRYLMAAVIVAVLCAACNRVEPYNRRQGNNNSNPPQTEKKEIVPTLNSTWKISYGDRTIDNGEYREEIHVNNVPDGQKYLVSVINLNNYAFYKGDVAAFLQNEFEVNSDFVEEGSPKIIPFNRFRAGQWFAFIIGLDNNEELTGEYAYCKFTVYEEDATEEYNSWIGNWTVSDGRIEYDIKISQIEANYVYRIDGWEVRKDVEDWEPMNQEYLEAFFEPSNDRLYFVSQYLTSYEDQSLDGALVDELFLGQINYDGISEEMGLYFVTDENFELAYAEKDIDDNYYITPCDVSVLVGKDEFKGKFYCIQYAYQEVDNGKWHVYNEDVARFYNDLNILRPMTMTKKDASQDKPSSIMKRNNKLSVAVDEKPLRGKIYQPRSEKRAVKAIKL